MTFHCQQINEHVCSDITELHKNNMTTVYNYCLYMYVGLGLKDHLNKNCCYDMFQVFK